LSSEHAYTIELSDRAKAALKRLDRITFERIVSKLEQLAVNAADMRHKALTGEWKGLYSLRVSDYRILYRLDHRLRLIVVELIGHRREVYDQ